VPLLHSRLIRDGRLLFEGNRRLGRRPRYARFGRPPAVCQDPRLTPAPGREQEPRTQGFAHRCQVLRGRCAGTRRMPCFRRPATVFVPNQLGTTEGARTSGTPTSAGDHVGQQTSYRSSTAANVLQTCWATAANIPQTFNRRNPAKPSETTHRDPASLRRVSPMFAAFADNSLYRGERLELAFLCGFLALCGGFAGGRTTFMPGLATAEARCMP
jgi:hypothetical protein